MAGAALTAMWAFAIFNSLKNELFLSRDRFGEKPLYLHKTKKENFTSDGIEALKPFETSLSEKKTQSS